MILVDSSSQAWNVAVNNSGVLTTTAVGGGGPTSVLLNDLTPTTTYIVTILTSGDLKTVVTSTSSNPTGYILSSPGGSLYNLQILNGLLETTPASAGTKIVLTGGNFQDNQGNKIANGTVTFLLNVDSETQSLYQIVSKTTISVGLDANGNIAGTPAFWTTTILTPSNSYYTVKVFTAKGQLVWGPNYMTIPNTSPFNIATWA